MKSRISSFLIFAGLCVFLLISSMSFAKDDSPVFADDISSQIKALEKDLSSIEKQRLSAEKALQSAKNSQATQIVLKRQYDNEISTIVDLISTTEELIINYDAEIVILEQKISELQIERGKELESFDEVSVHDSMIALAGTLGIKNGQLLWPLRVALSGTPVTPGGAIEIAVLLGKEESIARIDAALEKLEKEL